MNSKPAVAVSEATTIIDDEVFGSRSTFQFVQAVLSDGKNPKEKAERLRELMREWLTPDDVELPPQYATLESLFADVNWTELACDVCQYQWGECPRGMISANEQ